jgi:aspartate aminotransferase
MTNGPLSRRTTALMETESYRLVTGFMLHEYLPRVRAGDEIADFTFGNPHEMALPGVVGSFRTWIEPGNPGWFAYKTSEPRSQEIVAASLERFLGLPFEPEDIALTTGGFGALVTALKVVTDPGDEVIFSLPPWFGYEPMCVEAGVTPIKAPVVRETFDLDLEAIARAITPRTRLLIVNTPQNPTGKVLSAATLVRLAALLEDASQRNGRRIYLLSDEAYSRIVFDGACHRSPVEFYPWSFLAYSYGKTLLIPGMRVGYLAMPPSMPREEREQLRDCVTASSRSRQSAHGSSQMRSSSTRWATSMP